MTQSLSQNGQSLLPVLSLLVAALAVFIGPILENIAKFLHASFLNAGRTTPDQIGMQFENLMQVLFEIQLSLNPSEDDHKLLSSKLENLLNASIDDPNDRDSNEWKAYWSVHQEVMDLASLILKSEWTRIKSEDAN